VVESGSEEEDEEQLSYFGPVRKAGVPRARKTEEMGPPITTDEKMALLDPSHLHILKNFVDEARATIRKVMEMKGHRRRAVTDTVLREIAIAFPQTKEEMLLVEGMTEDTYQIVGPALLRLIQQARKNYDAIKRAQDDLPETWGGEDDVDNDIVEISDDDEAADEDDAADEFDDSEFEDLDLDESESSRYFSASSSVQQFNKQSEWQDKHCCGLRS
jgi:bloom syndrome protein